MYTKEQSHIMGIALRAQAIGDAIGEDFEFDPNPATEEINDYINSDFVIHITDDTQMTMFGIEGMLHNNVESHYLMWLRTQSMRAPASLPGSHLLIDQELMWQCRAPGNTCLSSLRRIMQNQPVENNSNGCGTVMKALPFLFSDTADLLIKNSLSTHKGPQIEPTARKQWEYAQQLMKGNIPGLYIGKDVSEIFADGGWQAESCLDIAIWAFENCNGDFNTLLHLAIAHDGDSDSIAATAGALYGLYYKTYPVELYNRIEEKDIIETLIGKVEEYST